MRPEGIPWAGTKMGYMHSPFSIYDGCRQFLFKSSWLLKMPLNVHSWTKYAQLLLLTRVIIQVWMRSIGAIAS